MTGCAALAGLGFGVTVGTVVIGESRGSLAAPGGLLTAAGRLAGFTGAYLMLIMVVLVARLPWLEVSAGQDRLVGWHRRVAPWAFGLIAAHVGLITLGYAQAAQVGARRQLWVFVTSYPDLLAAIAGFGLLVMAGVTSIRLARRRLKYETWWVVHLYAYLGLALAFAHQIVTGVPFIGHPLTRAVWIAVWACTAGMVLVFRVAQPIWRSVRHQDPTGSARMSPGPLPGWAWLRSRSTGKRSDSRPRRERTSRAYWISSMRRAPVVITATVAGLAGVLAFHSTPARLGAGTLPGVSGTSAPAGSSGSVPGQGTSGSGSPPPSSATARARPGGARTATGPAVNYNFGVLSVSATVSGGKITRVGIASIHEGGMQRSQFIDQQAIPILEQEAMQAQSGNIQGVSGASYTSAGFQQSLQGALQTLGFK